MIAEARGDRRLGCGALRVEIVQAVEAAEALQLRHNALGDGACVEGLAPVPADCLQGLGQRRHPHEIADRGRRTAGQEGGPGVRIGFEAALLVERVGGDPRRDAIALFGGANRRPQQFVERLRAMLGVEPNPGVDGAGHRDAMGRGRFRRDVPFGEPGGRGRGRRPARAVERHRQAAALGVKAEAIAADAGHGGFDDALHRHGREGRVHRIAAGFQDLDRGEGRQRMRGRRHAVFGDGERAAGKVEVAQGQGTRSGWKGMRVGAPSGLSSADPDQTVGMRLASRPSADRSKETASASKPPPVPHPASC